MPFGAPPEPWSREYESQTTSANVPLSFVSAGGVEGELLAIHWLSGFGKEKAPAVWAGAFGWANWAGCGGRI